MKQDLFECAFCTAMATGFGLGALAITILGVLGMFS